MYYSMEQIVIEVTSNRNRAGAAPRWQGFMLGIILI